MAFYGQMVIAMVVIIDVTCCQVKCSRLGAELVRYKFKNGGSAAKPSFEKGNPRILASTQVQLKPSVESWACRFLCRSCCVLVFALCI
jgi:hypothetical protein